MKSAKEKALIYLMGVSVYEPYWEFKGKRISSKIQKSIDIAIQEERKRILTKAKENSNAFDTLEFIDMEILKEIIEDKNR